MQHVPNLILTDIDECESASNDSICSRFSVCVNTDGTYDCICIDGTQLDSSENCTGMVSYDAKFFKEYLSFEPYRH